MDIALNIGPISLTNEGKERLYGDNNAPSFEIRGNSDCYSHLHFNNATDYCSYTRQDLLNIRRTYSTSISSEILGSLKSAGVLRYRVRKAGKRRIPVFISINSLSRQSQANLDGTKQSNTNNLIAIPTAKKKTQKQIITTNLFPQILVTNVQSLVPKIDEVTEFIVRNNVNIAFVTETWLKESVSNSVIDIQGFSVIREDRKSHSHGGFCIYIKDGPYK